MEEMTMETIFDCKILIVDDEPELCRMVTDILQREGFRHILSASNCREARQSLSKDRPDCVILDVTLPDGDGFMLLREMRADSSAPVLFLSARDEDQNRLLGLGLGADDYITKPFLPLELILRLKAVLNRTYFPLEQTGPQERIFYLGDAQIDLESGTITRNDGEQITLTAKEFAFIEKLYENTGKIVTIENLCHAAWGDNVYRYENSLMVHIRRLREKIEADPSTPRYLLTVRGLGYKLVGVTKK
jgi:DNA-binding response OmpR family regulator